ncbi:MAG TPA: proton-conducting transporter membrane subunit, partial [Vicinamibacterales bacterium]|nr:proton-conducting transporter membrane subunit [Vicinamibacterales bacterium]
PPWGIEYVVDPLGGLMAALVSVFAVAAAVYAGPFVQQLRPRDAGVFHAVYLLLTAGLLGIVVTGDLFNLYVFLEISSLAAYALLALGGGRSVVASFRYLLLGTAAGTLYLLGVGCLYAVTGTLNMADVTARVTDHFGSPAVTMGIVLIAVGLAVKTALFPLHGWLPDVYTYAPAPVAGFIAGVMTKVSAYAMLRVLFFVLRLDGAAADVLRVLGWVAAAAALAGSVMALAQTDVRRILAYSSVGQMGYIILGFAIGTPLALTGALLHVLNHAVMKSCLFLSAGTVLYRTGESHLRGYHGIARRMPLTLAAFTVAAASIVGLPPTGGFFSKWYLLTAAFDAGRWPFAVVLVVSSLLSAVYMFRVIERAYLETSPERLPTTPQAGEAPAGMLAPMIALAAAVMLLGVFTEPVVTNVIALALPPGGR